MDSALIRSIATMTSPVALVTVVETKGSVPRHRGSSMLVRGDGSIEGTVGGGGGEARAREAALEAIANRSSTAIKIEMLGDAALGSDMICGGTSRMLIEYVGTPESYRSALRASERGERVLFVKNLRETQNGGLELGLSVHDESLEVISGSLEDLDRAVASEVLRTGAPRLSEDGLRFHDLLLPKEKLIIFGGGHVGRALAQLAAFLDFEITIGDDRPEFADPSRFPPGLTVRFGGFARLIAELSFDAATYVVIMTRGHLCDLECVRAILSKTWRYAGFIGSARKTRLILEQLRNDGFDQGRIDALHGPIGLDIAAETPEEIAVSILAELIAVRRGDPGEPLRARRI
jgi:xanthine dehydrogenase accessory factor